MRASLALFMTAALSISAFVMLPAHQPSAQGKVISTGVTSFGTKVSWGEDMPLSVSQKISLKSDLKTGTQLFYVISTKGSANVAKGDAGALAEIRNTIRMKVNVVNASLKKPSPDVEPPREISVEYQQLNQDLNINGKRWGFVAQIDMGEKSPAVSKLFVEGKETSASETLGLPNPGTIKSNFSNKVAFARLSDDNGLTNMAHGIKWGQMPRDLPQAIADPLAFLRLLFPGIGARELEVMEVDGKLSAEFALRGIELPVEVATGRTALFDLEFVLESARGGAKVKTTVDDGSDPTMAGTGADGEVLPEKKDIKDSEGKDSDEKEIRLLTFRFVATPQAGQSVEAAPGVSLRPEAYRGTISIDPRTGAVGHLSIEGSSKGDSASASLGVTISLVSTIDG